MKGIKFPWQRRGDVAQVVREAAEKRLDEGRADWPRVHREAATMKKQRELNGWTGVVVDIFGTSEQRGQRV